MSKPANASPSGKKPTRGPVWRFFANLGPGLITGAADDDPSGIATYSVAGAQMGTTMLWTAFLTWPLMGCVQFMCARIGLVTGQGLAGALRKKFPRWLLVLASFSLLAANSINIGADLSGMADAAQMLTGAPPSLCVILFGVAITWATVQFHYQQIARILKWLAVTLFAYVVTAFLVGPDWRAVAHDTFIPTWPKGHDAWATLVALLGTTISPYLFYWQSSQEVEEEKAKGQRTLQQRKGASAKEIVDRKLDVGTGAFVSNFVMYFIILTTALTLHKHGITKLETSKQAAEALRPLAGQFAYLLYTTGLIGVGFLAIPTLAGATAYAFAETFHWRQGLDRDLRHARAFYAVIILSALIGIGLNFAGVNPVKALFLTSVINGVLAPFLLVGILFVARDPVIMNNQPSSKLSQVVVAITTLCMFAAAIGLCVF